MANNSMIIEIQPDSIEVTTVKDGVKSKKQTNLRAIQEVLTKDKSIATPLLPGSPWGTKLYTRINDRELIVLTTPPHIRQVQYDYHEDGVGRVGTFNIPLPAFCWLISLIVRPGTDKRQYNHGIVYALKNPLLTENDPLFQFPFSNVDDAWMCWGTMRQPELGNVNSLTSLPDRFLSMKFNNHLDRNKYTPFEATRGEAKVRLFKTSHLFEYLDEQQTEARKNGKDAEFRNDVLIPTRTLREHLDHVQRQYLRG